MKPIAPSILFRRRPLPALLLLLLALAARQPAAAQSPSTRDFTFIVLSDPHLGAEQLKADPPITKEQTLQKTRANLGRILQLPGTPLPRIASLPTPAPGDLPIPRGLFILGDMVDGHKDPAQAEEQWRTFETLFPKAGLPFAQRPVPVFALAGNHDGPPAGPARQGLIQRNRALRAAGHLSALSDNGAHFALQWEGVHFVCLNLCPADTTDPQTPFRFGAPGPGSWNDPQLALSFLRDYLRTRVGRSADPVFILQHYGFDDFSSGDWNWWTPRQRRAFYDLLAAYNIAAILHGHNHHAEHYQWPDPRRHAADLAAMFDNQPPASPRQYTILSCGTLCWALRIRGNTLLAAHLRNSSWSTTPAPFTQSLAPAN